MGYFLQLWAGVQKEFLTLKHRPSYLFYFNLSVIIAFFFTFTRKYLSIYGNYLNAASLGMSQVFLFLSPGLNILLKASKERETNFKKFLIVKKSWFVL